MHATMPMAIASVGVTYPAAGVIATRPQIAPATAPLMLGAPRWFHASVIHASPPIAAATLVLMNAIAAVPSAAPAQPALNPNPPTQQSAAPSSTIAMSCGLSATARNRGPSTHAHTRAATPEETCTTVPPAKSSAPSFPSQPPCPHTQCAMGSYTIVAQRTLNNTNAPKRLRSAKPPVISAGVITANII